jgi:hypothetical protein
METSAGGKHAAKCAMAFSGLEKTALNSLSCGLLVMARGSARGVPKPVSRDFCGLRVGKRQQIRYPVRHVRPAGRCGTRDLQLGLLGVQHLDPLWRQQRGHQLCLQQIGEHADGEICLSHAAETVQGACRNRCVAISVGCAW